MNETKRDLKLKLVGSGAIKEETCTNNTKG